nr:MAG TPA: hypothetical protein [Bacteriophage sp.]
MKLTQKIAYTYIKRVRYFNDCIMLYNRKERGVLSENSP